MVVSVNLNVMMMIVCKVGCGFLWDFVEVENFQVGSKGLGDFVSCVDQFVEKIICEELMKVCLSYGFVGEEFGVIEGDDLICCWIVDLLDGIINFFYGLLYWVILIVLEYKGQIVVVVVFDFVKDELFYVEKGGGVWVNESCLCVLGCYCLIDCIFVIGLLFVVKIDLF